MAHTVTVTVTSANQMDIIELPSLLSKENEMIFGDIGYTSDTYERNA